MKVRAYRTLSVLLTLLLLLQLLPLSVSARQLRSTSLQPAEIATAEQRMLAEADKVPQSRTQSKLPTVLEEARQAFRQEAVVKEKKVAVMVQMKARPAIESGLSEAEVKAAQDTVIQQVERITGQAIGKRVAYLANGFATWTKKSDIPRLAALPGVLNVREMPVFYPTMATAVDLSGVRKAWESHQHKGEGMVISIVDSGIDVAHPDMRLSEGVQTKLSEAKVKEIIQAEGLQGEYKTAKIPYGYDYADLDKDTKSVVNPHGMHVAGIAAANGVGPKAVVGVAPEAQLLAMKVFSDNGGGAMSIDIVEAIEDSVKLGADVINMSLGSWNGFFDETDGYFTAVHNAIEAGVAVIVAAGNDGVAGSTKGETNDDIGMVDQGTVGSPSTLPGVLSVASAENSKVYLASAAYQTADGQSVHFPYDITYSSVGRDGQPHELVDCGLGKADQIPADIQGKLALVQRGELNFSDKIKNAKDAGAYGILLYNSEAGGDDFLHMSFPEELKAGFFIASCYHSSGAKLAADLQTAKAAGKTVAVTFGDLSPVANLSGGRMSEFSSWGPTPDLGFKPELAAPGGHIYSCLPDGKHGDMSGTSMASPHVAGSTALLVQEIRAKEAAGLKMPLPLMGMVKALFENTAKPLIDPDANGQVYSPRQQGAGMIQVDRAMDSTVVATFAEPDKDLQHRSYGDIALGQITEQERKFRVRFYNFGSEAKTFKVRYAAPLTQSMTDESYMLYASPAPGANLTGPESITVPAGQEVKYEFTLNVGETKQNWIEGFLYFDSEDASQPSLSMPYVGFAGDWAAEPIFDTPFQSVKEGIVSNFFLAVFHETGDLAKAFMNAATMLKFALPLGSVNPLGNFFPVQDFDPRHTAGISPANADGVADAAFPQYGLLRAAAVVRYEICDAEGKVLRVLDEEHNVRKNSLTDLIYYNDSVNSDKMASWDGTVYNEAFNPNEVESDSNPKYLPVEEGQYFYRIVAYLTKDAQPQELILPVKVDNTAPDFTFEDEPEVEMVSDPRDPKKTEKDWVKIRVGIDDHEGTGVSAPYIQVEGDEIESKNLKIEKVLLPVEGEPNQYDLYLHGLALSYANEISISVMDHAYNHNEDAVLELSVGAEAGVFLTPYASGSNVELGDQTFVALNPAAKAEWAAILTYKDDNPDNDDEDFDPNNYPFSNPDDEDNAYKTTLWTELPMDTDQAIEMAKADVYPVLIAYDLGDELEVDGEPVDPANVQVRINDVQGVRADESEDGGAESDYVLLTLPTDQWIDLHVQVVYVDPVNQEEKVLYEEEGKRKIIVDSEPPKLNADKAFTDNLVQFNVGDEDYPEYINILFVPDDSAKVELKGVFSDNSQNYPAFPGYELAYVTPDIGKYQFLNRGDDCSYDVTIHLNWTEAPREYNFVVVDRSFQGDVKHFKVLKASDRNADRDVILDRLENGYGEGGAVRDKERSLTFYNLEDFATFGQAYENDTIKIVGSSTGLSRIDIGGVSVKPAMRITDPADPDYDPTAPDSFEIPVKLTNGFNKLLMQAYYEDENGVEQLYKRQRYVVLYDTIPPYLELSEETKSHIINSDIYTNKDIFKVSGKAGDNTVGFILVINGETVLTLVDVAAAKGISAPFEYSAKVQDGKDLLIELRDIFYVDPKDVDHLVDPSELTKHDFTLAIPVHFDTDAPTLQWSAQTPADGATVTSYVEGIAATATDQAHAGVDPSLEPPVKVELFLNGNPYNGSKLTLPGKYMIEAVATDVAGNVTRETRQFTLQLEPGQPVPDGKELVCLTDAQSGVQVWFYKEDLTLTNGQKVDYKTLTFHADKADLKDLRPPFKQSGRYVLDLQKMQLWDIYFTDQDGDRVGVYDSQGLQLRLPLDSNFDPVKVRAFHLYESFDSHRAKPLEATLDAGYAIFTVKHFSYYALSESELKPDGQVNPPAGAEAKPNGPGGYHRRPGGAIPYPAAPTAPTQLTAPTQGAEIPTQAAGTARQSLPKTGATSSLAGVLAAMLLVTIMLFGRRALNR